MTIPNLISIIRLAMVPFIVWTLLDGQTVLAFILFVVVGISDGVDGFIARRFNQQSELGAYLDPLADKTLLVTMFVALGYLEAIPLWLVVIVLTRDVLILAGVMVAFVLGDPIEIKPLFVSKANTAVQIVLVALALSMPAFNLELGVIHLVVVWTCAILTVASAFAYFVAWTRHVAG